MAHLAFKGIQLVKASVFEAQGFSADKSILYFVRTNDTKEGNPKTDGYIYLNGKKYGTGADVIAKYGELDGKTIAAYVAEQIKTVNTAATELEKKVTANTTAIEGINGKIDTINGNGAGSINKAVADAKTSLLGTATEGYQTLGELEAKIKDEASRADAAEKKNATAATDAKTAADNAQKAADSKIKSVEGTDTVVATTTEHAVSVSLKTSDKGNVKFTQDTDGLSANVTIPAATVTGVKAGDKVLALEGTELTSTISLSVDADKGEDGKKYIRLKGIDGADLGKIDTADFVKDGMLENAAYSTETHKITLTFNTDAGKEAIELDLNDLVNVYKAGNGLNLATDGTFSINTNITATKESVENVAGRVTTLESKVGSAAVEGGAAATGLFKDIANNKAAIAEEAKTARAAEKANKDAITILNGNDTVTGSVDKKIKDALEAGAVTLEVKDTDKYLGVTTATTAGKGTVYTLASKETAIEKAIKDAADAVKVSVTGGTYVKGSVDAAGRAITLSETVQKVADSSATAKGLAEASDVKAYVDGKVSGKNVRATGDTYVSATAKDNNVIVAATKALTDAVAHANSAVQSVNGKEGTAVVLNATEIEVGAEVGEQAATAKVNAVLADIYTKLGVVVKADGKTIKEATDHTLSVNLEAKETAQANGHVALEHGTDGALYGVMYYSGDDAE